MPLAKIVSARGTYTQMTNYISAIQVIEEFSGWTVCSFGDTRQTRVPADTPTYMDWCANSAGLWTILAPGKLAFQNASDALAFKLQFNC
jgi:hypothetical protein